MIVGGITFVGGGDSHGLGSTCGANTGSGGDLTTNQCQVFVYRQDNSVTSCPSGNAGSCISAEKIAWWNRFPGKYQQDDFVGVNATFDYY